MSFMAEILRGKHIDDLFVDTEVVYIMLADGTQITIRGLVVIEPKLCTRQVHEDISVPDGHANETPELEDEPWHLGDPKSN
jgi:hypothetical protein